MNWKSKRRGKISVKQALDLADSFSEDCRASKKIPGWALALRALACRVRMTKQAAMRKLPKESNQAKKPEEK